MDSRFKISWAAVPVLLLIAGCSDESSSNPKDTGDGDTDTDGDSEMDTDTDTDTNTDTNLDSDSDTDTDTDSNLDSETEGECTDEGCLAPTDDESDTGGGSDMDTDSDTDTDTDTDSDTDTDTDTDTDANADAGLDAGFDAGVEVSCPVYVRGGLESDDGRDGTTWEAAFADVQQGIDAAARSSGALGCEVWVAQGTYFPSSAQNPADERSRTILLMPNVLLLGGFDGTETESAERDPEKNVTILSGDLGIEGDVADNAYHVIKGASGAVIDGFTIEGGNADGDPPDDRGGGMFNQQDASPTVSNCTFQDNAAAASGGGMSNFNGASPMISNCSFKGNRAVIAGGGMYNNYNCSPRLSNCTFEGNFVPEGGSGGAMYNNASDPVMTNCAFLENSAAFGGALSDYGSTPTFVNCTFRENFADLYGGAFFNSTSEEMNLLNCVFISNTAKNGGAMYSTFNSSMTIANCTFFGNEAEMGGGMYNSESLVILTNSILRGDTADEISNNGDAATNLVSCNIQGADVAGKHGNIDEDPLFVSTSDLHLQNGSPSIDTGNTEALPPDIADLDSDGDVVELLPLDMEGNLRVVSGVVDMGAYEMQ